MKVSVALVKVFFIECWSWSSVGVAVELVVVGTVPVTVHCTVCRLTTLKSAFVQEMKCTEGDVQRVVMMLLLLLSPYSLSSPQ